MVDQGARSSGKVNEVVDTAAIIAIAGLTAALVGTLGGHLLQGYLARRNDAEKRLDERRHATYVDVITYAQVVEERLKYAIDDPLSRSNRPLPQIPDELMIRAKLVLVAPSVVTHAFEEVITAWDIFAWNLNEGGPTHVENGIAIFVASRDDKDVIRVSGALKHLKSVIRPPQLGGCVPQSGVRVGPDQRYRRVVAN